MIAAEEYRDEIASRTHANAGRFWQRMTMNFEGLWRRFVDEELGGPNTSTSARIKAAGQLYLLPRLGSRFLAEISVEDVMSLERVLQATRIDESRGSDESGRRLSPAAVARVMSLGSTVWRYGRRVNLVDGNPFANLRKAKADLGYDATAANRSLDSTSIAVKKDPARLAIETLSRRRRHSKP
jgi:hypothetical protein